MSTMKKVKPGVIESPWTKPATASELKVLEAPAAPGELKSASESGPAHRPATASTEPPTSPRAVGRTPKPRSRMGENDPLVTLSVRVRQSVLDRVYEVSHRRRRARVPREESTIQTIITEALAAGLETVE